MPTTMPSVVPHPMQLSNLATAVRMRSQEGSSPLSSPIQKPAPNRKPRKKRVDLHGKLEAMSDEPLADLLRAQTQPWTPEEDHGQSEKWPSLKKTPGATGEEAPQPKGKR